MAIRVAKFLGRFIMIILTVMIFVYYTIVIEYNSKCPCIPIVNVNQENLGL